MTRWLRRQRWWLGRTAMLPVHLAIFAVVIFFVVALIPGDEVRLIGGSNMTSAEYSALKRKLGFDHTIWHQLGSYLNSLVHGDLGTSHFTQLSVWSELEVRAPATLELTLIAVLVTIVVTLGGSYLVVFHPRNPASRVLAFYARLAGSVPQYVVAVAAIFIFYSKAHWVPAPLGLISSNLTPPTPITNMPLVDAILRGDLSATASILDHLILPVGVLVYSVSDFLLKITIRAVNDAVDAPPTLFRIGSGARRRTVIISAYRRALPATVVVIGATFGFLLGGAVIIENLFGLGALGQFAVTAVQNKDLIALRGFLLFSATVSLVIFLIVDLLNMVLDPRRRIGSAGSPV